MQFCIFLALIYIQINLVASFMQRCPKKTKAESIKSKAVIWWKGNNEGGESSFMLEKMTTADNKFNSYEVKSINDN